MIGSRVTLIDGAGRRGKIVAGSLLRDNTWVVEWENTNRIWTHEKERDIRILVEVERKPVAGALGGKKQDSERRSA